MADELQSLIERRAIVDFTFKTRSGLKNSAADYEYRDIDYERSHRISIRNSPNAHGHTLQGVTMCSWITGCMLNTFIPAQQAATALCYEEQTYRKQF